MALVEYKGGQISIPQFQKSQGKKQKIGKWCDDFLMVKNSFDNISLANPKPKFIVLALGRVKSLCRGKLGMLVESKIYEC